MKKMTSRERFTAALEHRESGITPVYLMIEPHCSIKIATEVRPPKNPIERLAWRAYRDFTESIPNKNITNVMQLSVAGFQGDLFIRLGGDAVDQLWTPAPLWLRRFRIEKDNFVIRDMYGIERSVGGLYFETVRHACQTPEELDRYTFPDLSSPIHYAHVRQFRKQHPDIFMTCWIPGVQDWGAHAFYPMEKFYTGMIEYPDLMKRTFRKLADHSIQIVKGMSRAGVDGFVVADDYGTQNSMFISRTMWKEFTFPMLKSQCDAIHKEGKKAMLHSCGTVAPLLDLFVEAGLDGLHPFQPLPGNNLDDALDKYGGKLCFIGGIDVQKIAAQTPQETYDNIMAHARKASAAGGFILAHTNGLQGDTPVENLKAMFDAIDDVKKKLY